MANRRGWRMSPGETLTLGKGFANDLKVDEVLTGSVPRISVHTRDNGQVYADVTGSLGFIVADAQPNGAEFPTWGGETVAIGKGVVFVLTASEIAGQYYVRIECDGNDGSHVVTTPFVELMIEGPATPS